MADAPGFEIFMPLPDSKWNEGVMLQKYGDTYSVISANTGQDGKNYMRWCFPQGKDREPIDKSIPWKIGLGNRLAAIGILRQMLEALEGQTKTRPAQQQGPPPLGANDEDIPF